MPQTITITFCECAENHVGMEQIGLKAETGFSYTDLKSFKRTLRGLNIDTQIYSINLESTDASANTNPAHKAYILIARCAVDAVIQGNLMQELTDLEWDTTARMYGRVVNKKARHNLCFADYSQEPTYAQGKGTIVSFADLPLLGELRQFLNELTGDNLLAEGNLYYDVNTCGIGYHGDSERRKVVGVRLGSSIPLVYQWFYQSQPIGSKYEFVLNDGDIYIMSDKAVGFDWKLRNSYTLRHAAGSAKYTGL